MQVTPGGRIRHTRRSPTVGTWGVAATAVHICAGAIFPAPDDHLGPCPHRQVIVITRAGDISTRARCSIGSCRSPSVSSWIVATARIQDSNVVHSGASTPDDHLAPCPHCSKKRPGRRHIRRAR